MPFSEFKSLATVQQQFQIYYEERHFITTEAVAVSPMFQEELQFTLEHIDVYNSEASRCKMIIAPILREVYKKYHHIYAFWIQKAIGQAEPLTGTPDYLFSMRSPLGKTVMEKPLVVVVEAKQNDFIRGWGQCLAELVAAQQMNEATTINVYGIVTDGNMWQFGLLAENRFIKEKENFTIDNLPRLFGALNFILQSTVVWQSSSTDIQGVK